MKRKYREVCRLIRYIPTYIKNTNTQYYIRYLIFRYVSIVLVFAVMMSIIDTANTNGGSAGVNAFSNFDIVETIIDVDIGDNAVTKLQPIKKRNRKRNKSDTGYYVITLFTSDITDSHDALVREKLQNLVKRKQQDSVEKKKNKEKEKKKHKHKKKQYRYQLQDNDEFNTFCRCVEAEVTGEHIGNLSKEEIFESKLHVAQVILNRVESKHFPNTIREVVYQPSAFSPLIDGRFWDVEITNLTIKACKKALKESTADTTYGCEYFSAHTDYCKYGYAVFTDSVDHTFFKEY